MRQTAHRRKERVTVSLSREAVRFLRRTRAQAKLPSLSALFEKIVAGLQGRTEQKTYDERMRAYYDSLSASGCRPCGQRDGRAKADGFCAKAAGTVQQSVIASSRAAVLVRAG